MNEKVTLPTFKRLPDYGEMMLVEEFCACVDGGGYTDDDGCGQLASSTQMSDVVVYPSMFGSFTVPSWATHVVWFNK